MREILIGFEALLVTALVLGAVASGEWLLCLMAAFLVVELFARHAGWIR